jgi:uncharacterized cupredoxin-like copper-binding protein
MSQPQRARAQQQATRRRAGWAAGAVVTVIVVAGAVLAVTAGDEDGPGSSGDATRVSMTEFAFDPAPIALASGPTARLEVVNDGAVPHDLVVGELGKGTPDLEPGASMVLDLSDQPPGTYRVVCDLPGHTEAGMVTELTLR